GSKAKPPVHSPRPFFLDSCWSLPLAPNRGGNDKDGNVFFADWYQNDRGCRFAAQASCSAKGNGGW
ncbi:MAG: hypothetical protein AAF471_04535, partial [Myxococcota bacterium]